MVSHAQALPDLTTQEELDVLLPEILPAQGKRTEEQYLWLTDHTKRLIECTDGFLVTKRGDYAEAGIPEYWIVNPDAEAVTVLSLREGAYVEHRVFGRGTTATSLLLEGFSVEVDAVLDAT